MNKQQFFAALRARLSGLPQADVARTIDYYGEMIDDRIEEGFSEEEAVAQIGSVESIAAQIISETPVPAPAPVRQRRALQGWQIALIVVGAPLWLPIGIALFSIAFSLWIVAWSMVIVLYSIVFSFAAAGIVGMISGIITGVTVSASQGLLLFGAGLACAGLCVLLFVFFTWVTKQFVRLHAYVGRSLFGRRKKNA